MPSALARVGVSSVVAARELRVESKWVFFGWALEGGRWLEGGLEPTGLGHTVILFLRLSPGKTTWGPWTRDPLRVATE